MRLPVEYLQATAVTNVLCGVIFFLIVKLIKIKNMSNLREKAIEIAKQTSSESAFMCGYDRACKEYEEKLRWIPISEQFPPPCTFVDTMYKYTYAYLFHLENGEFDNCAYNPTHWRLKII